MRKTALLMLCAGFGVCTEAGALPVNNSGYQGNAGYGVPATGASDSAIFEVLGRLEQLQSEVQQLRGLVEEQSQTIADLERKQGNMYSDLDERIQMLTSTNSQAAGQAAPAAPSAAVGASQSATTPSATAAPTQTTATTTQSSPVQQPATAPAPVAPVITESKPAEATAASAKASEKERYQAAYDTLRNGHNAQAIKMFETLQTDYPAGEFGDNTQYWLGEAYKINREFDKARAAFSKVVSQYPNSSKVPDAILKLGYIEFDQQNLAKARDYLTRVTTSYPNTTAAHLAAKKLAQMPQ